MEAKKIPLSRGYFALIDADMFDEFSRFTWWACVQSNPRTGTTRVYAYRQADGSSFRMHRQVLGFPSRALDVDHINGDTLDNRRVNLRACSRSQNNMNARKRPNTTSRFKGVCWLSRDRRWVAQIAVGGKQTKIGYFKTEVEAARAYNAAAAANFGEFARTNPQTGAPHE